jgi:hypothetical protein
MHYEVAVSQQDLTEFTYNTKEVHANLYISQLPTYEETIGYEIRGHVAVIKFEETEGDRITYGNPSYTLQAVSQVIALACVLHKVKHFQLGASVHTIHVAVNDPQGAFIAKQGQPGVGIIKHQVNGLVFKEEGNFFMALEGGMVCSLYVDRMGTSLGLQLIDRTFLIRFEVEGKFHYYPMALVFTDPVVRSSYLKPSDPFFDWDSKREEIEQFVEEWTK